MCRRGFRPTLFATKYGFTRDDCDAYAVESQKRAAAATAAGRFEGSRVAVKDQNGLDILTVDEQIRPTEYARFGRIEPVVQGNG